MTDHKHDGIEHTHDEPEPGGGEYAPEFATGGLIPPDPARYGKGPDDVPLALGCDYVIPRKVHGTPLLRADADAATDDDDDDDDELGGTVVTTKTVCAVCEYPAGQCGHSPGMTKEVPI